MEINQIAILEGFLYLAGDDGVEVNTIAEALKIEAFKIEDLIIELKDSYSNNDRGLCIQKFANKYRLTTKKEYFSFYEDLFTDKNRRKLSTPALETLAIIAYKGPITKQEIESIRGVNCDSMVLKLKIRNIIIEHGKTNLPGRPMAYVVSDEFLKILNIESIDALPDFTIHNLDSKGTLYE